VSLKTRVNDRGEVETLRDPDFTQTRPSPSTAGPSKST